MINIDHTYRITGAVVAVIGFTTTYAISAYHHWCCEFEYRSGWGVQHLCDKVSQWLAAGRWFSPGTPASSTNKTDCHDITEILLKVVLNTIIFTLIKYEVDAHLLLHISNVPHSLHANPLAWSLVSYGILNPMVNWTRGRFTSMVYWTPLLKTEPPPFLIKRYAGRSKYHV